MPIDFAKFDSWDLLCKCLLCLCSNLPLIVVHLFILELGKILWRLDGRQWLGDGNSFAASPNDGPKGSHFGAHAFVALAQESLLAGQASQETNATATTAAPTTATTNELRNESAGNDATARHDATWNDAAATRHDATTRHGHATTRHDATATTNDEFRHDDEHEWSARFNPGGIPTTDCSL